MRHVFTEEIIRYLRILLPDNQVAVRKAMSPRLRSKNSLAGICWILDSIPCL